MFVRKPGSMVGTVESPAWLIKRIAWRMQANHEGGLTERARQRARELACDADLRLSAPRKRPPASIRTCGPPATHRAAGGFPPSLAETSLVTCTYINGFLFFKLQQGSRS
jgi:hypothetical protein